MLRKFVVQINMPEGVTPEETASYIMEAIKTHRGGFHPEDPFFNWVPLIAVEYGGKLDNGTHKNSPIILDEKIVLRSWDSEE